MFSGEGQGRALNRQVSALKSNSITMTMVWMFSTWAQRPVTIDTFRTGKQVDRVDRFSRRDWLAEILFFNRTTRLFPARRNPGPVTDLNELAFVGTMHPTYKHTCSISQSSYSTQNQFIAELAPVYWRFSLSIT